MKITTVFLIISFSIVSGAVQAQLPGKITGQTIVANKKPLDGAVISLLRSKDSALIKTVITDSAGRFEFINLKPDTFFITVSNIEYQKYISKAIIIDESRTEAVLPAIELQNADAGQLTGVTVVAKVPFVERKIDRTVINPDALISNAGSNAMDVLEKSPGVQVDMNGVISLKGKQGVIVYIDDKPTYMSSADLANYLRSLPSSSLGLIEIMTNPPAKYDAAGNAGVINIKLKRNKTKGFNGGISSSYGQGTYARTNNSINFNYRINKINFFTNAAYNINNSYQDLYIKRQYYRSSGDLNSLFNQNSFIKRQATGANTKLGLDYYISKKSTAGIVLSGFKNVTKNTITNTAELYDAAPVLQNRVVALSPTKRTFKNGSINLNYAYKFNTAGTELLFNFDGLDYTSLTNQSLLNSIFTPGGGFISKTNLISNLPADISIKTAKADFAAPVKNGGMFEAGIKTSFINTNNIAEFFDEVNSVLTVNNDFSNNFKYKENINAAYVNYNFERKKLSVQTGLRFENTNIKGRQLGNPARPDSSFKRRYDNLFPTFYLSYKLDTVGKNQLDFSYGRRIDRPDYQAMNPFTYPLDRFTLYSGNPFLQPTFSNNFEISHTYKNIITTSFQYSYTKDVIQETIETGNNIFYSRPGNIGKQISYNLSVNGTIAVQKWWTLQFYTEVVRNIFKATLYGQNLNNKGTYWYIGPTNQFKINKSWSAELAGTYLTSVSVGQFVTIPVWNMRAGVSKKMLKDKGVIKLNISDMFYTNQPGGDIKSLANSAASWLSYLDSRVATISFSYRFNKGKSLAARTTGGSDSEKNRVK